MHLGLCSQSPYVAQQKHHQGVLLVPSLKGMGRLRSIYGMVKTPHGIDFSFMFYLVGACRQAGDVGAFINLESTGPGGPDIVFQASGDF